jgi:putative inorganic carbon (HCO3(-)) transporter
MTFLYTFLTFLQPGDLAPALVPYRPMLIVAILTGLPAIFARRGMYAPSAAFKEPAFVWLVAFVMMQALSMHYAGVAAMVESFGYWQVFLLFVVISIYRLKSVEELRRYIWGVMVGSMVIVVYGIYAVAEHLPCAVGGRAGAYGMYENHNDYSFIIIMILPFLFVFRQLETKRLRRLLLGVSLLTCIFGIFLSLSRGGVIALVLELVLIVIGSYTGRRRALYVAIMVMFGVAAVGYQWAKRAENQGSNYTAEDAESSRMELWKAGANMVKAHPFLGVGSRHFSEFSRQFGELSGDQIGKNSHNTYIEVISTSGLFGFVSFMLMLRAMVRTLRKKITIPGQEWLEAIRSATLITTYSIMLRSLLDAKPHDWSFYVLCSIAISYGMMRTALEREAVQEPEAFAVPHYVPGPARAPRPGFTR